MSKDPYVCTDCKATFTTDFHKCPECVKGCITLNKQCRLSTNVSINRDKMGDIELNEIAT